MTLSNNTQIVVEPYNFITTIEVNDTITNFIVIDPNFSIVEVAPVGLIGPQGPQGDPGPQGPAGSGSDLSFEFETINIVVSNPSNVSYTLPHTPRPNTLRVYLNGLRENMSLIVLTGSTVNFSILELGSGDLITFDYQYQL